MCATEQHMSWFEGIVALPLLPHLHPHANKTSFQLRILRSPPLKNKWPNWRQFVGDERQWRICSRRHACGSLVIWNQLGSKTKVYFLLTEKEVNLRLTCEKQLEDFNLITKNAVIPNRLLHKIQGHYLIWHHLSHHTAIPICHELGYTHFSSVFCN